MPHPAPEPAATQSGQHSFRAVTAADLDELTTRAGLAPEQRLRIRAPAAVLGFHTTSYVTEELIDWSDAPDDPIYRLVFPEENMLPATDIARITDLLRQDAPAARIADTAQQVRASLCADHASVWGNRSCRACTAPTTTGYWSSRHGDRTRRPTTLPGWTRHNGPSGRAGRWPPQTFTD